MRKSANLMSVLVQIRRRALLALGLSASIIAGEPSIHAAPANDHFSSAASLTGSYTGGTVNFVLGRFEAAAVDFEAYAGLKPKDRMAPIWLYLAKARAGKAGAGTWFGLAMAAVAKVALVFTMLGLFVAAYVL